MGRKCAQKLDTFPSTYTKDFRYYPKYSKPPKCGLYEPFELSESEKERFRPGTVVEALTKEMTKEGKMAEIVIDPDYMKSVYQVDYLGGVSPYREAVEKILASGNLDELISPTERHSSEKPIEPLVSSLRVVPGLPRYYKTCTTEYHDTFHVFGEIMKSGHFKFPKIHRAVDHQKYLLNIKETKKPEPMDSNIQSSKSIN